MVKRVGDRHTIKIKGLPALRLCRGIELPLSESLKGLTITRRGRRLFVNLTYAVEAKALAPSNAVVGIDMGVTDRMALSTGETIKRRRKPNSCGVRSGGSPDVVRAAGAGSVGGLCLPITSIVSACATGTSVIGLRLNWSGALA